MPDAKQLTTWFNHDGNPTKGWLILALLRNRFEFIKKLCPYLDKTIWKRTKLVSDTDSSKLWRWWVGLALCLCFLSNHVTEKIKRLSKKKSTVFGYATCRHTVVIQRAYSSCFVVVQKLVSYYLPFVYRACLRWYLIPSYKKITKEKQQNNRTDNTHRGKAQQAWWEDTQEIRLWKKPVGRLTKRQTRKPRESIRTTKQDKRWRKNAQNQAMNNHEVKKTNNCDREDEIRNQKMLTKVDAYHNFF